MLIIKKNVFAGRKIFVKNYRKVFVIAVVKEGVLVLILGNVVILNVLPVVMGQLKMIV
jgi:hypothetical protein